MYVEAATILETRIGNRLLSGACLMAGVKSWQNMHLDNSDPFLDDYIQDCEIEDVKIYLQNLKRLDTKIIFNIGKCIFCLGRSEEALLLMEMVCQEEESSEKILFLANCYNTLGQRDVAAPLFSFVLADGLQVGQISALAHLIYCGKTSTNPSAPY